MAVLAACSILSLGVVIERLLVFVNYREEKLKAVYQAVIPTLKSNDSEKAAKKCKESTCPFAGILHTVMSTGSKNKEIIYEAANRALRFEILNLEKNLGILATIGSVAPFIGLFGTVLGIINAFHALSSVSAGGPGIVSKGIAEALVTTAGGLFVAVPAVIFYNYFVRKAKRISAVMEEAAYEAVSILTER